MLYCGYSGVGKTTLCAETDGIDLDSSNFEKVENWEAGYISMASKLAVDGKDIFLSAHPCVIEMLMKLELDFVLIIPDGNKDEWVARLAFRWAQNKTDGNLKALADCVQNFEKDMEYYHNLNCRKIKVHAKKIQTDLKKQLLQLIY